MTFSHAFVISRAPRKNETYRSVDSIFFKINLCEKKRVSINVHAGFVLNKNSGIFWVEKKLFVLQEKRVVFLPNDLFFDPLFTGETRRRGEVSDDQRFRKTLKTERDTNYTNLHEFIGIFGAQRSACDSELAPSEPISIADDRNGLAAFAIMAAGEEACPKCGGNEVQPAGVLRRSVNPLMVLFGGFLLSLLWSSSRKEPVRCVGCDTLFERTTRVSKIARFLLIFFILLILLGLLAVMFGPEQH